MNSQIYQWAIRNRVSAQALEELKVIFGLNGGHFLPENIPGRSEASVQALVRMEGAEKGYRLFRNNVGALKDEHGRLVRYGLANDSKQINKVCKSGDLIGWRSFLIESCHIGLRFSQFVSRECKEADWVYTGTEREVAQLNWAQLVMSEGGDAAFCTGIGTLS